jgi:hypothetical protein
MSELVNNEYLHYFKRFLDEHVDCRLEAMLTEDNRTANHEDRTAELESKIEELESQVEYYSDHEDRICELEETVEAIDRSQLLKDLTTIVDRRVHELASRGRLRIYVASSDPNTVENVS